MSPRVLGRAAAPVRPHLVFTSSTIPAGRGILGALVDVLLARLAREERRAVTDEVGLKGTALTAVGTWV